MGRRFAHLGDVEALIVVVEHGSLTAGAIALGTTPSVLSRAIARLEARLGCQLLRRTTRSIGLTDAGRLYLEQSKSAFALIDDAERAIQGEHGVVSGRIRLSVPTTYGHYRLPGLLSGFVQRFPQVQVDINISNRNVDLVAEGFDFAIRLGQLRDSGLIARKLEDAPLCLVAAPDYLQRMGTPHDIDQLAQHRAIAFLLPSTGRPIPWQLRVAGADVDFQPNVQLEVTDDALGVVSLAESGLGICQSYDFIVRERLARGSLVEILPQLRGRSRPFSLLYAAQRRLTAAARAFIDHLQAATG